MGIGLSIFLIALGLILAFAVHVSVAGVDVQLIGLILAGVGILGLVLFFTLWSPRRRMVSTTRALRDPGTGLPVERPGYGPAVVEERRVIDDGGPL